MKRISLWTLLLSAMAALSALPAQAGKQAICHFPPGNPENFHTISVSDKAVATHVEKHGDFVGSCLENCEAICDDGDFCTQDVASDPDECVCLPAPGPPIDCNDSNDCTADSCDSVVGACLNNAEILDGQPCDDNDPGTTGEVCTAGVCAAQAVCPCAEGYEMVWSLPNVCGSPLEEVCRDQTFSDGGEVIEWLCWPGPSPSREWEVGLTISSEVFLGGSCWYQAVSGSPSDNRVEQFISNAEAVACSELIRARSDFRPGTPPDWTCASP